MLSALLFLSAAVQAQELVYPDELGFQGETRGKHLFPSHHRQPSFYSIAQPGRDDDSFAYFNIPQAEINNAISGITMDSLLIHSICSYGYRGSIYYVINAGRGDGSHEIALNLTMDELQETIRIRTENRIEVRHICAREDRFDVVWHHAKNFVTHFMVQEGALTDLIEEERERGREGYYPDVLQRYETKNESSPHAVVVWRKGYGVRFRTSVAADGMNGNETRGAMRLSAIAPLDDYNHIALYRSPTFTWRGRGVPRSYRQGPLDLSMVDWEIESQMRSVEIPSVSIAILRGSSPFFVRAYGYADILDETAALPSHRYRIASVSKTITAMLITSLVNGGKLSYGDRVFGHSGLLSAYFRGPTNIYLRSITVQHLLEHSAGAWSHFNKLEFSKRELTQKQFLEYILMNFQPRSPPGRQNVYSNIGYLILGRIIEAVSGLSYEEYARRMLLAPLGIVGGSIAKRKPLNDEVTYFSHDNASPYLSWDPERLDSAAGWTLKAIDVAKIIDELHRNRAGKYRMMIVRGWTRPISGGRMVAESKSARMIRYITLGAWQEVNRSRWPKADLPSRS